MLPDVESFPLLMRALPVVRQVYRTMTERTVGRNLILAFDGTKNEFGRINTNVVNLCAVLKMNDRDSQMVYYQPGIGTYTDPSTRGKLKQWWAKTTDLASAWYLSAHVMRAYEFLMDNWLPGDSIMLFGFSRGAYTARVLASMLDSVGLLSRGNREQVPFAYRIYASQPDLATRFKDTFCTPVDIQLVGLWDTVASMGLLVPKQLPLASFTSVKHFRHAISLDETRARFNVTLWDHEPKPEPESQTGDQRRVKEMWFVGGHCDVGGGNRHNEGDPLLANIPFRWMLHEIHDLNVGVLFDNKNLDTYSIPTDCVPRVSCPKPRATHATNRDTVPFNDCTAENETRKKIPSMDEANDHDVTAAITLELKPWSFWWLFQLPVWTKGSIYWGQRIFPEDHIRKGCTHIHPTVIKHMELMKPYQPNALLPAHWKAHIDGLPDTFD